MVSIPVIFASVRKKRTRMHFLGRKKRSAVLKGGGKRRKKVRFAGEEALAASRTKRNGYLASGRGEITGSSKGEGGEWWGSQLQGQSIC